MDPERKKDMVRTGIIIALFLILFILLLDHAIGDPAAMPVP